MERVPEDGFAAGYAPAGATAARLKTCGEKRHDDAVCGTSTGGDSGLPHRREQHELRTASVPHRAVCNLALDLCDDGLRLREPVELIRHFEQLIFWHEMKSAIAPRS